MKITSENKGRMWLKLAMRNADTKNPLRKIMNWFEIVVFWERYQAKRRAMYLELAQKRGETL